MADSKYTYNKEVNASRLESEIRSSVIVTALNYITVSGLTCDIFFKSELSSGDEDVLDTIVENHNPTPLPSSEITSDGKLRVYNSPRPFGNRIMFIGQGDNMANNYSIGGGTKFKVAHVIGGSNPEVQYCDFNTIENETYLLQCMATYEGMKFDELNASLVPRVTTVTVGSGTNYNVYGGYLVIPAAGNGTAVIQDSDRKLVEIIHKEDGTIQAGYWNADYNTTTHEFENITAAPLGNGGYNMFSYEITMASLGINMFVRGSTNTWVLTPSNETDKLVHGSRIKMTFATVGDDHDWTFAHMFVMYRKKTV